jgi:hypothetical protein
LGFRYLLHDFYWSVSRALGPARIQLSLEGARVGRVFLPNRSAAARVTGVLVCASDSSPRRGSFPVRSPLETKAPPAASSPETAPRRVFALQACRQPRSCFSSTRDLSARFCFSVEVALGFLRAAARLPPATTPPCAAFPSRARVRDLTFSRSRRRPGFGSVESR